MSLSSSLVLPSGLSMSSEAKSDRRAGRLAWNYHSNDSTPGPSCPLLRLASPWPEQDDSANDHNFMTPRTPDVPAASLNVKCADKPLNFLTLTFYANEGIIRMSGLLTTHVL